MIISCDLNFPKGLLQYFCFISIILHQSFTLFEETNVIMIANSNPIVTTQWYSFPNYLALKDIDNWNSPCNLTDM